MHQACDLARFKSRHRHSFLQTCSIGYIKGKSQKRTDSSNWCGQKMKRMRTLPHHPAGSHRQDMKTFTFLVSIPQTYLVVKEKEIWELSPFNMWILVWEMSIDLFPFSYYVDYQLDMWRVSANVTIAWRDTKRGCSFPWRGFMRTLGFCLQNTHPSDHWWETCIDTHLSNE